MKKSLVFLIRESDRIVITRKIPKDVEIDERYETWSLRGLPPGRLGDFDQRFYYNDDNKDVIGVFDTENFRQLKNLLACYDWHLRDILGQPHDQIGEPEKCSLSI